MEEEWCAMSRKGVCNGSWRVPGVGVHGDSQLMMSEGCSGVRDAVE